MFDSEQIEVIIEGALRAKLGKYVPESSNMPFYTRLLGKDRMALFSFIQSMNTSFGTAIFEKVAITLAADRFDEVATQKVIGNTMTTDAERVIQSILNKLTTGEISPSHAEEIAQIRPYATTGDLVTKRLSKADVYLANENQQIMIELKTAKPNINEFESFKRQLLDWAAAALYQRPDVGIRTIIAAPYNPYHPKPYKRWTMRGILEIENQSQFMVGEEFWNFLAGEDIYEELLNCFERVGLRMKDEIDARFSQFAQGT